MESVADFVWNTHRDLICPQLSILSDPSHPRWEDQQSASVAFVPFLQEFPQISQFAFVEIFIHKAI